MRTSENTYSRDCLESSGTGWIARLLLARGTEKEAFHPVPWALEITKWSLSGVSRQSLEGKFSEVQGSKHPLRRGGKHSTTAWWPPSGVET